MLIRITEIIKEAHILELLSYSIFPDPEQVEYAVQQYVSDERFTLFGYVNSTDSTVSAEYTESVESTRSIESIEIDESAESTQSTGLSPDLIGIIGILNHSDGEFEIKHLAVRPEYRGLGYGRGLILELLTLEQPKQLVAETDEEGVGFYRSIGFTITSLGEKYPGVERFHCLYETDTEL